MKISPTFLDQNLNSCKRQMKQQFIGLRLNQLFFPETLVPLGTIWKRDFMTCLLYSIPPKTRKATGGMHVKKEICICT